MKNLKSKLLAISNTKTFNVVAPTVINIAYSALLIVMLISIYYSSYYQNLCPNPFWKVCTP